MIKTEEILRKDALERVRKIKQADVVIGIPSYQNARTIGNVVEVVARGLVRYFPTLKGVIVNADGSSTDGTRKMVRNVKIPPGVEKVVTCYKGPSGKGSAFRTIFAVTELLEAQICITIDADSRSISPEWIERLGSPIYLYSYGYVAPYYLRDKHDGTITNALVYPMTRALYGMRVRQPIGGDFGLTAGLAQALLHQRVWKYKTDVAKFGVDIWMTTTAVNEGLRTCQASLGVKVHDAKRPGSDISDMLKQVSGTMFGLMRKYETKWRLVKGTMPAKIFGGFYYIELEEVTATFSDLVRGFAKGVRKYEKLWKEVLAEENFWELMQIAKLREEGFQFPVELWAKIVYDYAVAYNFSSRKRGDILDSLLPLYFGRTAAFVVETGAVSQELADAVVEGVAGIFERLKPYLLRRWSEAKQEMLRSEIEHF